jgi:anti-sigma factor RsiW
MKNDVLERLLIDRAAGELPPDVEELLEAHLQQEPAARKDALEIEETLRLARLVLTEQPAVVPLPSQKAPKWIWAMAACFVCGLLLGIFGAREKGQSPAAASAPIQQNAVVATAVPEQSDFWSTRHFHGAPPGNVNSQSHVVWTSVFKKPEIF